MGFSSHGIGSFPVEPTRSEPIKKTSASIPPSSIQISLVRQSVLSSGSKNNLGLSYGQVIGF